MSLFTLSILLLVLLFLMLGAGVWVAFSLLGVGIAAMILFTDAPLGPVMAKPWPIAATLPTVTKA